MAAAAAAEYMDPRPPADNLGYESPANRAGSQSLKFKPAAAAAAAADKWLLLSEPAPRPPGEAPTGGDKARLCGGPADDTGGDARLVALNEEIPAPAGLVPFPPASVGLRTGLALTLPEPMVESLMEANPLP